MSEENTTQKEVVIYSTPTCHFCQLAKAFFNDNNIAYTEHDVQADPAKGQEMVQRTGQRSVPMIFVGEELVMGFDEAKIRELLGM